MNQIDTVDRFTSRIQTWYAPRPGLIDIFSLQINASGITKSQSARVNPSVSNEATTDSLCSTLSIKWDDFSHPLPNAVRNRISCPIFSLNVTMNTLDIFLGFRTYWVGIHTERSTRRMERKAMNFRHLLHWSSYKTDKQWLNVGHVDACCLIF